jgi:hypothetical protein
VQRAVVPDVPDHDRRHIALGAGEEYRRARHARDRARGDVGDECADRHHRVLQPGANPGDAAMPDLHDGVDERGENDRNKPAMRDLGGIRREEPGIDEDEDAGDGAGGKDAPAPDFAHGDEQQHRGHQHRRRDGDAIGRGEIVGLAETNREPGGGQHQEPVDRADIDLSVARGRGLGDGEPRQPAEQDRLPRHREGAGDDRLAGNDRR